MTIHFVLFSFLVAQFPSAPAAPRDARIIVSGIDRGFDWREPFRPEPWWPVGGAVFRYFDHSVIVAYGRDVPALVRNIQQQMKQRKLERIARIEVWTHGGPGYFRIQDKRLFADTFASPPEKTKAALARLREVLAPDAVVHFRSCSTFHGEGGLRIARAAADFFNATGKRITIMGHTRPTGLTHPGWQTIAPGDRPAWPRHLGESERILEGMQIAIRDLARIFTGGVYDALIHVRESVLPRYVADARDWFAKRQNPTRQRGLK